MNQHIYINAMRRLADMANATAWINFTAAQANHDINKFGEWRCAYDMQAGSLQVDFDNAGRELIKLLNQAKGESNEALDIAAG